MLRFDEHLDRGESEPHVDKSRRQESPQSKQEAQFARQTSVFVESGSQLVVQEISRIRFYLSRKLFV